MKKIIRQSKIFFRKFLEIVGITSGIITILLAFWDNFPNKIDGYEVHGFVILIIMDILLAILLILPKKKVKIKLSETVSAKIYYGDIFDEGGITVIPVNEYFDTIVDDKIVSSNTLHGIFIKNVFGGNTASLQRKIKSSLANTPIFEKNSDRKRGNKTRYKLGTVAQVEQDGIRYFLVAFTRFNENNRAEVTTNEYQQTMFSLFNYIEQYSQGAKLNLPLIGSGHSGVPISKQKLLEFLVFTIQLNDKLTLISGVDIILHDTIMSEIDLNSLDYYYSLQ